MEYIQTILFQIPASRMEEASQGDGLLPKLDAHRNYLRGQFGFLDLRVTRSINNEGNILIVVETRWSDDASLVRYETSEPNAASIVREHINLLVPNSLQVLDMEALRTESSFKAAEAGDQAHARVTLPVLIPLAVLAFALLFIYGLSRVYLEIGGDEATALAAGIAIGVLIIAFFLAMNRRVKAWQIVGVLVVGAAVLTGGTIWAVSNEDEGSAEEGAVSEPTGAPGESGTPTPNPNEPGAEGLIITMIDNKFEFEGQEAPSISTAAGQEHEFQLQNDGSAIHNMHVATAGGEYGAKCEPGNAENPCSDPATIKGGSAGSITFTLDAGEYPFRCDFHPTEMTGTLVVE